MAAARGVERAAAPEVGLGAGASAAAAPPARVMTARTAARRTERTWVLTAAILSLFYCLGSPEQERERLGLGFWGRLRGVRGVL